MAKKVPSKLKSALGKARSKFMSSANIARRRAATKAHVSSPAGKARVAAFKKAIPKIKQGLKQGRPRPKRRNLPFRLGVTPKPKRRTLPANPSVRPKRQTLPSRIGTKPRPRRKNAVIRGRVGRSKGGGTSRRRFSGRSL